MNSTCLANLDYASDGGQAKGSARWTSVGSMCVRAGIATAIAIGKGIRLEVSVNAARAHGAGSLYPGLREATSISILTSASAFLAVHHRHRSLDCVRVHHTHRTSRVQEAVHIGRNSRRRQRRRRSGRHHRKLPPPPHAAAAGHTRTHTRRGGLVHLHRPLHLYLFPSRCHRWAYPQTRPPQLPRRFAHGPCARRPFQQTQCG